MMLSVSVCKDYFIHIRVRHSAFFHFRIYYGTRTTYDGIYDNSIVYVQNE